MPRSPHPPLRRAARDALGLARLLYAAHDRAAWDEAAASSFAGGETGERVEGCRVAGLALVELLQAPSPAGRARAGHALDDCAELWPAPERALLRLAADRVWGGERPSVIDTRESKRQAKLLRD